MTHFQKFTTRFASALTALVASTAALAAPAPAAALALQGGTWLLTQVNGAAATGAHLRFAAGQVQGNDACNSLRSSYQTGAEHALRFAAEGGAATLMACAPEQEKTAKAFKAALAQTQSYSLAGQTLTLLDAEKKALAVFTLQNDKLDGTTWQLQGLNNGKDAVVSQASTEKLKIAFLPHGKLSASTPCGQLQSYYHTKGKAQSISIRQPRADGKTCTKSDAAYAEHQQLRKALKKSSSYQITGTSLELRDKKGSLQISAQAAH
jgi:heat shock protein HslJ